MNKTDLKKMIQSALKPLTTEKKLELLDKIRFTWIPDLHKELTEKAIKGQLKCKCCGKYSKEKDFIYDNRIEVKNVQTYSDCGYGDDDRFGDVEFEIKYARCPKCGKEHEVSRYQRRILWGKRRGE